MDRDFEDVILLEALKLGSWLWEGLYKIKSISVLAKENLCELEVEETLWISRQLEKTQLKLTSPLVLHSPVLIPHG